MYNTANWVTRILATLITIVFVVILISNGSQILAYISHSRTPNLNMYLSIAPGILVLAGFALSWWRARTGGIFFILASLVIVLDYLRTWSIIRPSITVPSDVFPPGYTVIGTQNAFVWVFKNWAMLGFPLVIIGILFFVAMWMPKKNQA